MQTYQHITLATAKTLVAQRLGDAGKRFHVDTELQYAIVEARRWWNLLTAFDRDRGVIDTTGNEAFYYLSTLTNGSGDQLRAYSTRDRAVFEEIQYHLMEHNGVGTLRTDQFTAAQITNAIQRRRNQFLADTGAVLSEYSVVVPGGSTGRVDLPDSVISVRRAVYKTASGRYYTLRVASERTAATTRLQWRTHGVPMMYTVSASPQLTVQLSPPPMESGTLEMLVVLSGADLDINANSGTGTLLGVPDDVVPGIKYGAIADLLNDYRSTDTARAERCEQMYQLAVDLTNAMPTVLYAELDGMIVHPAALAHTDLSQQGWQSKGTGAPTTLSMAGPDLIVLTPVPDNNPHSIQLDVVRSSVVPTANSSYLQIGRESVEALLGQALSTCAFKLGGNEYSSTIPQSDQFFEQAKRFSMRRSAASTALQTMLRNAARERTANQYEQTPRVVEDTDGEVKSERNARRRPFRIR